MTPQDNGGAAFPSLHEVGDIAYTQGGMTLRDWFAGQALVGLCASPHNRVADGFHGEFATHAYMLADALLAARSAK